MVQVFKEVILDDGTVERFEPYAYSCGNYMRGNSTKSSERMVPESSLSTLADWISARKQNGELGGVRMRSLMTGKAGLHTIHKIEVR